MSREITNLFRRISLPFKNHAIFVRTLKNIVWLQNLI